MSSLQQNLLKEKILVHLKQAMKDQQKKKVSILRFLQSEIKNKEIALRPKVLTESHIIEVIKGQIKKLQESFAFYKKAGYTEQAQEQEFQLSVLQAYMPKLLSEKELKSIVNQVILDLKAKSIKDMGVVMKTITNKYKNAVDGKTLAQMVREKLSNL